LAIAIDNEIFGEIYKFLFSVQQMIVSEFCAVKSQLEKGKTALSLTSLSYHCLFFHRYLLSCRHIFHEFMYGTANLLTSDAWENFQSMFNETGFEIYTCRKLVILEVSKMTEVEKEMENRKLAISELTERMRDIYWRVKDRSNAEQTATFISKLRE
jgi:hypothetical protein